MELLRGLCEIAEHLGVTERRATRILQKPGCPVLPRVKGEGYLVVKEALDRWLENGCPGE